MQARESSLLRRPSEKHRYNRAVSITVPEVEPPRLLYKYLPPERVDVVEGMALRFSRPTDFNDTFDSYHRLPLSAEPRTKAARIRLRNMIGILCLAESPDNHMMWVNYAKQHSGFVVGFDAGADFFGADGRTLRKVVYQTKPPVFKQPDENGCFYKAPVWNYEQEWRCVRRFERDESRLVSFEWSMIKTIVLGSQMDPWVVARLVQSVTMQARSSEEGLPEFRRSVAARSEWAFSNEPDSVRMCEHCQGDGVVR